MAMTATFFNGAEPFEQIVNIPSTEGSMRNLVKIGQAVSEKIMQRLHDFIPVYCPGARADNLGEGGPNLILTKRFYYFDHTL